MISRNLFSRAKSRYRGFTLIELLISVILAAMVTAAAMGIYITQHKQLLVQEDISDMQSSIRASAVELATNIRMAGYNIPEGVIPLEAYNTNPDTIVVMYDTGNLRDVAIDWPMPQPSAELRCDDDDLSGLHDSDWVYIYDPSTQSGEFFLVTQVQYASGHIQHNTMPLSRAYPLGSVLYRMDRFKYYIDRTDPHHPNLMVEEVGGNPQVYAENITDLNFRYVLSSGAIVDVPPSVDMVREIIIEIDARTNRPDEDFQVDFRTRDLTTRVKVRNLGIG